LGSCVRAGEIINTRRNSVRGWLHFYGRRQPLLLQLTGNCHGRLRGRHLRFRTAPCESSATSELERLQPQQVGPAGYMDLLLPAADSERSGRLCLEWYSQNGWIRLELTNPQVEFLEEPSRQNLAGDPPRIPATDSANSEMPRLRGSDRVAGIAVEEPAGLVPANQRLPADEYLYGPAADSADYWQLVHEMSAGDEDVPLSMLFDPPLKCLPDDQLDDLRLEQELRKLLALLAIYGVAVDVCEHFTDRETYRVLLREVLPVEETYPRLPQIGYVQHYLLHNYCPRCEVWP
jgi:hypothetical protein